MPTTSESADRELTDEELQHVAGGAWYADGQLLCDPDRAGPGTEQ